MRVSSRGLLAYGVVLACGLAAGGFGWELLRFGASTDAAAARLEAEVRQTFDARAIQLRALSERVAARAPDIAKAIGARDTFARRETLAQLFRDLGELADVAQAGSPPMSITVYAPAGPRGEYRVLAWSDGPSEQIPPDRLSSGPTLYAAPSTLGLPLIDVQPVLLDGARVAVAAATTILASVNGAGPQTFLLNTSYGPVELRLPLDVTAAGPATPGTFVMFDGAGRPVLEAHFANADIVVARRQFRSRALTVAALPLVAVLVLLTGRVLDRRARTGRPRSFWLWSAVAAGMVVAAGAMLLGLMRVIGWLPEAWLPITGLTALGTIAVLPGSWWRQRHDRRRAWQAPVRYAIEQLVAGAGAAAMVLVMAWILAHTINADALGQWRFPLFSPRLDGGLFLAGLQLIEAAAFWAIATTLAASAERWRISWRAPGLSLATAALWVIPHLAALALVARNGHSLPWRSLTLVTLSAAIFALGGAFGRRRYRHTTQALRLTLLFGALLLPAVVWYPAASFYADRTARLLVEQEYAPATLGYPDQLREAVADTAAAIDRFPSLDTLVTVARPAGGAVPTQAAFSVWSQTRLATARLSSAVELYGPDRTLVSRFALNVPEYLSVKVAQTWQGTSCDWVSFAEITRFGAEERSFAHAERGICDAAGKPRGAIVVKVLPDYRALPFVSSENPYYDVLHDADITNRTSRIADLQVVKYGWGFTPEFTSGNVAWPITPPLFTQLYASREPFWTTLSAENRPYRVYFTNDRSAIYAIGYPTATLLEHLTRLAEAGTVAGVLFIVLLLAATLYQPFTRGRGSAVRAVLDEVRTSFYRKLFLYFVAAAIVPVFVFAVAFGGYMAATFRVDVESEAASVVTVARRVLEESLALQERQSPTAAALTDDVMVLIGQVINQDVNLFNESQLIATSQRDLFESGLLPTRTPATVYRSIVLERLPSYVHEDRLGDFRYLVAAAPVPTERDQEAVLIVPLALRQREIEREIDDLNRGVLAGAVFVILLVAGLGVYVAGRISDPVSRLSRATRQIAAGRLDIRIVADTADELGRLVDDFNSMAATLNAQRAELARTNQLKAWAEMARQVAHEIKNPLTPIQLAAEHLQRVHSDRGRPLGGVFDQCVDTILSQVRTLRQIASEFSNFAAAPTPHFGEVAPADLLNEIVTPYQTGLAGTTRIVLDAPATLPAIRIDRTLIARALTNVIENALQAMPHGGMVRITAAAELDAVVITLSDTGVGMDEAALARAFEPYFSTKTGGSGLGVPNAQRNVERCGGTMTLTSALGRGTTVTIRLPRAADPAGAIASSTTPSR